MNPSLGSAEERKRIARNLAVRGVIIIDPSNTYIEEQVSIGPGTVIEPGAVLLGGTSVGEDCKILGQVRMKNVRAGKGGVFAGPLVLEDCVFGDDATVGPFAQMKRSRVGNHFTAQHLCYLGDLEAGHSVNIGAGSTTANWNGEQKSKTKIGNNCFIGVNTIFVAQLVLGDESGTAAGTVVTRDVPQSHLAIRRVRKQTNVPKAVLKTKTGWRIGKQARLKK